MQHPVLPGRAVPGAPDVRKGVGADAKLAASRSDLALAAAEPGSEGPSAASCASVQTPWRCATAVPLFPGNNSHSLRLEQAERQPLLSGQSQTVPPELQRAGHTTVNSIYGKCRVSSLVLEHGHGLGLTFCSGRESRWVWMQEFVIS